jgi:hypothetical protein
MEALAAMEIDNKTTLLLDYKFQTTPLLYVLL